MTKSIFIGNIPYGAMEKEIEECFSACGTVHDVHFVMDFARGRFRGFGFVTMDEKDAEVALATMDGHEFQGRQLKVSPAQANQSKVLQSAWKLPSCQLKEISLPMVPRSISV